MGFIGDSFFVMSAELLRQKIFYILCLLIGSGLLFLPNSARAQLDFSDWIMPGPLSKAHESLKGAQCNACHATAKGVPDRKCLDCHKEIAVRVQAKRGYHGRLSQDCRSCHPEHKGEDWDVTGLSRIPFSHHETGWPLEGAHSQTSCNDCHDQKRKNVSTGAMTDRRTFLGAPTDCAGCHESPHQNKKKAFEECSKCHSVVSWNQLRPKLHFNHNKETRYPLTGSHQKVQCFDCHKTKAWAPLPFQKCTNCHVDPHKGQFGNECTKCHSTATWRGATPSLKGAKGAPSKSKESFDHNKTAFPLTGEHKNVTCLKCHGPTLGKMPNVNFKTCEGCHKSPHGNQFKTLWTVKNDCESCHLTDGWGILSFQHNRDSRYKLEGKHLEVDCNRCHKQGRYRWMQTAPDCNSCHKDVHKGQFKEKTCASCHQVTGFKNLLFDHNRDSPFPLVGKHQSVNCASCHPSGKYKPIDRQCQSCHNDFHNGELGNLCMSCHAPTSFKDVEFDHNRGSRFPLQGAHVDVSCNKCHLNYKYKLGITECSSCHLDVHKGAFGSSCNRCHTTEGFDLSGGFHDFGEFSLGGAHDRLECDVCHGESVAARAQPMQCTTCHRDPHMNSLGRDCYRCHTQNSWLPTTFRHNQTGFELSGAHRFLSCDQCHSNRVFGGLPQECVFCHRKDFVPTQPQHIGAPLTCETCHFTYGFRPAR